MGVKYKKESERSPVSGYDLANMLYAVSQKFSQEDPGLSVKFAYVSHALRTGLNGFSQDVSQMTTDDITGLGGICSKVPEVVTDAIDAYAIASGSGNGGLVCDKAAELYLTEFFPGIEQKLMKPPEDNVHTQPKPSQSQYFSQDH